MTDEDFDWDAPITGNEYDEEEVPLLPDEELQKEVDAEVDRIIAETQRKQQEAIVKRGADTLKHNEAVLKKIKEGKSRSALKNIIWIIMGILLASLVWGINEAGQPAPSSVAPVPEVVIVPDTKTVEVEVHTPTEECVAYLVNTQELWGKLGLLADAKQDMKDMLTSLKLAGFSPDSFTNAELQRQLNKLDNKVANALATMSSAQTQVGKYEPGQTPCN